MAFFVAVWQKINYINLLVQKYKLNMKTKSKVIVVFGCIFLFASIAYFAGHIAYGSKNITTSLPQDIGKIKYVDGNGDDVFVSGDAVVFNQPVFISNVEIENNAAKISVVDFLLVRAPAYGVVTFCENGTVKIDHGNETESTISGIATIGVIKGDLVLAGQPIGSCENEIIFSVNVDDLPLDMNWLIEAFSNEETR